MLLIEVNVQVAAACVHEDIEVVVRLLQRQKVIAPAQTFVRHAGFFPLQGAVVPSFVEARQYLLPENAQVSYLAAQVLARDQRVEHLSGLRGDPDGDGALGAIVDKTVLHSLRRRYWRYGAYFCHS
jgi:hypothetical protein